MRELFVSLSMIVALQSVVGQEDAIGLVGKPHRHLGELDTTTSTADTRPVSPTMYKEATGIAGKPHRLLGGLEAATSTATTQPVAPTVTNQRFTIGAQGKSFDEVDTAASTAATPLVSPAVTKQYDTIEAQAKPHSHLRGQQGNKDVPSAQPQHQPVNPAKLVEQAKKYQDPTEEPRRRKLVSYQSSPWEQYWLENGVEHAEEGKVCQVLMNEQLSQLHDYLNILCTSRMHAPYDKWCVIDDGHAPLWFNSENKDKLELTFERPTPLIVPIPPPEPIIPGPESEHILSKLTYFDEATAEKYVEYIEPLVGSLQFPLQKCMHPVPIVPQYKHAYASFRGFILPPPPIVRGKKAIYIDAGAKSWESKAGGASPKFVYDTWMRHGVAMDKLYMFDGATSSDDFLADLPANMLQTAEFRQCSFAPKMELSSDETPYLPSFINRHSSVNDYVVLKVDVNNIPGRFKHLSYLDSLENQVDELIWETKSSFALENMARSDLLLGQAYEMHLLLRQKGIRTHSML